MLESEPLAAYDDSLAKKASVAALAILPTDGERLMRFRRYRDESAFAEVVETHAPLVWGVCSQILRHQQDVEDAFQATFLILARKAKSIRAADNAAGWLYRVAFRTALLARDRRNRRNEAPLVDEPRSLDEQLAAVEQSEQTFALLEELNALPPRYRQPLVLCYMEGRTRREAADEMGVTSQTVKGLLARGTRMLRSRLVRRGAALSTSMAALSAAMSASQVSAAPTLVPATAALGARFALKLKRSTSGLNGTALKGAVACKLAEKGILAMTIAAASKPAVGLLGICLAAGMLAIADAEPTPKPATGGSAEALVWEVAVASAAAADDESGAFAVAEAEAEPATTRVAGDEQPMGMGRGGEASSRRGRGGEMAGVAGSESRGAMGRGRAVTSTAGIAGGALTASTNPDGRTTIRVDAAPNVLTTRSFGLASSVPAVSAAGPSEATLALEQEYWTLKANGLRQKVEAIQAKVAEAEAKQAVGTGAPSAAEILELSAEQELTRAEVKLCELNSQRINESLGQINAVKLRSGATGEEVRRLQRLLNQRLKPAPKLDEDADFGPLTERAVITFQKMSKLKPTGVVDAETWARLEPLGKVEQSFSGGWNENSTPPQWTLVPAQPAAPPVIESLPGMAPPQPAKAPAAPQSPHKMRLKEVPRYPGDDEATLPKAEFQKLLEAVEAAKRLEQRIKELEQDRKVQEQEASDNPFDSF